MFVSVRHEVRDPSTFQERGHAMTARVPDSLRVHHLLPATDLARAACLWEGPSLEAVRSYIDTALGDASTQTYFTVADEYALGLPAAQEV